MVRKSMWAIMAVLLACGPGALAYEYRISQSNVSGFTYASELLGPGSGESRLDYGREGGPTVTLWTILTDDEEGLIRADDEMELTLTIANAQFAQNVRAGDVTVTSYYDEYGQDTFDAPTDLATSGLELNVTVRSGGSAGTSSVTFDVRATGVGWADNSDGNTTGTSAAIQIELPTLTGLTGGAVTASIEVDAGGTSGGSGFKSSDAADVTVQNAGVGTDAGMTTSRAANSGVLRLTSAPPTSTPRSGGCLPAALTPAPRPAPTASTPRPPVPLVGFTSALTFCASGGGTSNIDITGNRMMVQPPAAGRPAQSTLASVSVGVTDTTTDGPKQLGGERFSIATRQDGEGELVVSVTGEFHAMGDQVWLDLDRDNMLDNDEVLSLENGVMSGRFQLTEVAGDGNMGESEAEELRAEEGVTTTNLIFMPNGTETIRPATYRSTFSVDFDAASNADKAYPAQTHTTRYFVQEGSNPVYIGDELTRHAYAIPPLGHADEGNVRVKCETATACPVYLECDDSGGGSWFAELSMPVEPRATVQLSSETIAGELEVGEAGWTGRLSCTVMSTRDISLQVLTRSGGALINNTYVDN